MSARDLRRLVSITCALGAATALAATTPATMNANTGAHEGTASDRDSMAKSTAGEDVALGLGTGDVTPSGGFEYSVPIELPPGRRGVAPSLSIAYDSQMGNGLMGMGWTLRGLPAVVRVPYLRGLMYDGADQYALASNGWGAPVSPGMRLVRLANGKYHTLEESWVELEALGQCGDGPCAWRMRDGHGNTMYFGSGPGSQLDRLPSGNGTSGTGLRAWAMSRFEDPNGNSYGVTYEKDTWMMYPTRLEYGCNPAYSPPTTTWTPPTTIWIPPNTGPSLSYVAVPNGPIISGGIGLPPVGGSPGGSGTTITIPGMSATTTTITLSTNATSPACTADRELVFQYQVTGRPDPTAMPGRYERLLTAIDVYSSNLPLRGYRFGYDQTRPHSRLTRVDRLGSDFLSSLPPVTIGWTDAPALPPASSSSIVLGNPGTVPVQSLIGDVDGDGIDDVVRVRHDAAQRRIDWLRGTTTGLLLQPHVTDTADNADFHAVMADVNGDGKKDVIDFYMGGATTKTSGTVEVWVAYGGAGGLGTPRQIFSGPSPAAPGSSIYTRGVAADLNGDLIPDLLLINQDSHKALFFLGTTSGLSAKPRLIDGGFFFNFPASPGEPIVTDVNGDQIMDVVMPAMVTLPAPQVGPIHMLVWLGGHDAANPAVVVEGPARVIDILNTQTGDPGWTPYQTLAGDFNGDGVGDFLLGWSGQPEAGQTPIPFGRDLRAFYGRPDLGATGVRVFTSVVQQNPNPPLPTYSVGTSQTAFWQQHAADLNGDGITDVVMTYHGAGGEYLQWLFGRSDGSFTSIGSFVPGGGLADGTDADPKWQTRIADVDLDGRDDVIRAYVGQSRTIVDVFRGTLTGLAPRVRLVDIAAGDAASPPTAASSSSAVVLVGDVNGDGKPDLVVSGWGRVLTIPSLAGVVDRVASIDEGMGGATTIDYETSARVTGAIVPTSTTCGGGSGLPCGMPDPTPRPLAIRVTVTDGRNGSHGVEYTYSNGRYVPGPVEAQGATQVRADLGFEMIERRDHETGRVDRTRYRQLWPLARNVSAQEVEVPSSPGSPTRWLVRRESEAYDSATHSIYGTVWVRRASHRVETFEQGSTTAADDVTTSYTYNDYGAVRSSATCAPERPGQPNLCIETVTDYAEDASTTLVARRWLLNRPIRVRTHVAGSELVLDWREQTYVNDDTPRLATAKRLQCLEADNCTCFSSANAAVCTVRGDRWVTTTSGLVYDSYGNVTQSSDALGRTTVTGYDATFHTLPASSTRNVSTQSALVPFVESRTYDFAGRLATQTDVRGAVTTYGYDPLGRKSRIDYPNGGFETWQYLSWGTPGAQRIRHVRTTSDTAHTLWDDQYFDGRGSVYLTRKQSEGTATVDVQREDYFAGGVHTVIASRPHYTGAVNVIWSEVEYDPQGRLVAFHRRRDAALNGGGTRLATLRRLTYVAHGIYTEDNQGAVDPTTGAISVPSWRGTTQHYTARGKLADVIDAAGGTTVYSYDAAQRPNFIDGPGATGVQWTSFIYDGWGRVRLQSDSASGETQFLWDDADRLKEQQDALLRDTAYTYDELDRPRTRATALGMVVWSYDGAVANGKGRLTQLIDDAQVTTFSGYDVAGNLLGKRSVIAGQTFVESMTYDLSGRLLTHTEPDKRVLAWRYSDAGRNTQISLDGAAYAVYADYDAQDRPGMRVTAGGKTSFAYGPDDRLGSLYTGLGSAVLQSYSYGYDGQGNLLRVTDARAAATKVSAAGVDTDDTWSYGYDPLDRLTSARDHAGATTSYAYDPRGNVSAAGARSLSYSAHEIDAKDVIALCLVRIGAPPAPCNNWVSFNAWHAWHDDAGELTRKDDPAGSWTYRWNDLGHLQSVALAGKTQASFSYDADGRRRVKALSSPTLTKTTTIYLSPSYELRLQGSARAATVHVIGMAGEVLASVTDKTLADVDTLGALAAAAGTAMSAAPAGTPIGLPAGVVEYLPNHQGSIGVVLDGAGHELSRYVYAPWGAVNTLRSTGGAVAIHGFTGQEQDAESALIDEHARAYDPELMRMISPDSLLPGGGADPQGLNRYAYALDNPVRYRDPSGHEPEDSNYAVFGDYAGLLREQVLEFFRQNDIHGDPLETPYLLWSGQSAKAEALAAVPDGWFMNQTAEHFAALDELKSLGWKPGVQLPPDVWQGVWDNASRPVARRAALSGTPVYSFGLDPVNPDVKSVQYRVELPTVARWGGLCGGLMIGSGGLGLYSSLVSENRAQQFFGSLAGIGEITGGIMYGSGALLGSGDLMLYGAMTGSFATFAGIAVMGTIAVYDLADHMIDWSAASHAPGGDWITAPTGYKATAEELQWLHEHGAEALPKYMK